jgi:hypothetical protein
VRAARPAAGAARPEGGSTQSRAAEISDLIVTVIAVTAALLLDLAVFAFLASH